MRLFEKSSFWEFLTVLRGTLWLKMLFVSYQSKKLSQTLLDNILSRDPHFWPNYGIAKKFSDRNKHSIAKKDFQLLIDLKLYFSSLQLSDTYRSICKQKSYFLNLRCSAFRVISIIPLKIFRSKLLKQPFVMNYNESKSLLTIKPFHAFL